GWIFGIFIGGGMWLIRFLYERVAKVSRKLYEAAMQKKLVGILSVVLFGLLAFACHLYFINVDELVGGELISFMGEVLYSLHKLLAFGLIFVFSVFSFACVLGVGNVSK
ncbi:hypothetical protein, partial [Vibrio tubiashii]